MSERKIQYYAAPMEGITGYIYRNAHRHHFGGIEKYYTPFLTPKQGKGWTSKEKNDVLPAHNADVHLVPQILTNRADWFVRMAEQLYDLGYEEVNLNLGCPSGTVTAKGKGSGFLADTEALDRFFEEVFQKISGKVSVKTRLGIEKPEEMKTLMEVYNRYPIAELVIHARVQKDMYKKPVNREMFGEALAVSCHPVCYNGDIFTLEDGIAFSERFSDVERIMVGRGLLMDPALAEKLTGKGFTTDPVETPAERMARWRGFHQELCDGYEEIMSGERNVLFKMKELWNYMIESFPEQKKYLKKIKKASQLSEYKKVVEALFEEAEQNGGSSR